MIPKSFVQDLLNRVDIADVVDGYVPLKRAGANLVACCPFHSEKSPSFTVSPSKQFYHCFGCGAHGSAIGFLMEHVGMSFVEAVKDLAGRVGMTVPEERRVTDGRPAQEERAQDLTEVLQKAAVFYKSQLKKSDRAIAYLRGRGLTGEIAARFGLGYAPAGWQGLAEAFPDYQSPSLVEAGLVIAGDDGKRYDRFRDRVMFPIVNQRGQVIGFGGRVMDKSEPKYLNSPETPVFEKGRELYGLYQARQAIRAVGRVLVVEGYMDVVALAQYDVGYAVATLGTATSATHVQKLLRQSDEVVFCFDGDAAGRRAAWRALENSLEQLQDGKQVRFLFLPPEHDPDSFVRTEGKARFEHQLAQAVPLSAFLLNELTGRVDLRSPEGAAKFLQDFKPLVKRIGAPILALMIRKRAAELSGLHESELDRRLGLAPPAKNAASAPVRVIRRGSDPHGKLLERVLAEPTLLGDIAAAGLPAAEAPSPEARTLVRLIEESRALAAPFTVASLMESIRGAEEAEQTVRAMMPAVQDLQKLSLEELRVEVLGLIDHLRARTVEADAARTLAALGSPQDLTDAERIAVVRALQAGKSVQKH